MLNFETICRVCMKSEDEMVLIFDEVDEKSIGIAAMMGACNKYKVHRHDGLPQRICKSCLKSLNSAYSWKENCEASYRHLMQLLSNSKEDEEFDNKNIVTDSLFAHVERETQTETSSIHLCERCDRKFFDLHELRIHRANDHKGSAMVCRFCSKPFNRIGYLRSHIAIFHPESGYTSHSQCEICQRKFSRKEHMRRHMAVIHKIGSADNELEGEMDDTFDYNVDMDEFTETENTDIKEPFPSDAIEPILTVLINEDCGVDTIKLEDIEEEDVIGDDNYENLNTDDHVSESKIEESHSSSSISKEAKVKKSKSSARKKFTCVDCKKSYVSEAQYKKHCTTKHNEKELECKRTEETTFTHIEEEDVMSDDNYEDLNTVGHVSESKSEASHSSSSISKAAKAKKSKSSARKKFTCEDCKKTYVSEAQYKKHKCSKKHNEKKYECKSCAKTFIRRNDLRDHIRTHGQKHFTCKECAQNFNGKEELIAHRKAEGHDKPMLCPECGLRCKSSSSLMAHMRRHNGEKPYKCKFCGKGFPRSDDLKVHEKYHTGEKSHFCETCGKGFQRKYNLTIHLRVHTGEKPYKCPHCPQAFSQGNDLKSHIRRHTGERFRCDFCDASFLQSYQMRQHKLTEHGIKEQPPTQRVAKFTSLEQQEQQIKVVKQNQQTS